MPPRSRTNPHPHPHPPPLQSPARGACYISPYPTPASYPSPRSQTETPADTKRHRRRAGAVQGRAGRQEGAAAVRGRRSGIIVIIVGVIISGRSRWGRYGRAVSDRNDHERVLRPQSSGRGCRGDSASGERRRADGLASPLALLLATHGVYAALGHVSLVHFSALVKLRRARR